MTTSDDVKLSVFNDALFECGVDMLVTLAQTNSQGFRVMNNIYPRVRAEVLEEMDWDWAQTHFQSTGTAVASTVATPFGYKHTLPSYTHRLVSVHPLGRQASERQIEYQLFKEDSGGVRSFIYCDEEQAEIAVIDSTKGLEESFWPALFQRLISLEMANRASAKLGATKRHQSDIERRLREARRNARGSIRVQRGTRRPSRGSFVSAHLGHRSSRPWRS